MRSGGGDGVPGGGDGSGVGTVVGCVGGESGSGISSGSGDRSSMLPGSLRCDSSVRRSDSFCARVYGGTALA